MVAPRKPRPPATHPTPAELRRADKAARRPDGSVDAFAFAAAIARPLGIRRAMARRALREALGAALDTALDDVLDDVLAPAEEGEARPRAVRRAAP